jgi:hypothetical protein
MKLTLNKRSFLEILLGPVSKISDNLLLQFVTSEPCHKTKTLVSNSDRSLIFLGEVDCVAENLTSCIIPDCKTFLRLFSGIEEDRVALTVKSNTIEYVHANFSFKYHLLDEVYAGNQKSISEEKLLSVKYDTSFEITKQKFSEIVKYNSIVPDAEKLYFFTKDGNVLAKIGDDQKSNTNEIQLEVSGAYSGLPIDVSLPINIQNILLFSFDLDVITASVNHSLKIMKFETPNLKYIVSGLVK